MKPTTPLELTGKIQEFCNTIIPDSKPIFVALIPEDSAKLNECFSNVKKKIEDSGGSIQYGWTIWELPNLFLEAEFHAIWIDPSGKLIDITPKQDNEEQILFLPDPVRQYEGELIENIRKPLVDNEYTRTWIILERKRFQFKKKHFRGGKVNALAAGKEYIQFVEEAEEKRIKFWEIGRNEPCPCGSGKKYKKCCDTFFW
ncbi:MAG: SEC-C metal-binding domain-containing protein [Candidatus Thorarchaeota archaeon]